MLDWKELKPGMVVTVQSVSGSRELKKKLERDGIMSGSDLTVVSLEEGKTVVSTGRFTHALSPEECSVLRITEEFKRHNDPVLLGGCCAYGNSVEMVERVERVFEEMGKQA